MDIQLSKADSMQKVNSKNNDNDAHHQFPIIKFQSVEYLDFKSKIEEAEKKISNLNEARTRVAEKLQGLTSEQDYANTLKQKNISRRNWYIWTISWKKREIESLQKAIEELNSPNKLKEKGNIGVRSSHDETNVHIKNLRYRIQHGSNNLAAERKLLREIKEAKEEKEKISADVYSKPNNRGLRSTVRSKKDIKNRIKLISSDLERLEMGKRSFDANLKRDKEGLEIKMIEVLKREMERINRKKDEVYKFILQLKMQSDEVEEKLNQTFL